MVSSNTSHGAPFFSKVPLAIFPPVLGILGAGLALNRATNTQEVLSFLTPVAHWIMGLGVLLWLMAACAYSVKLWRYGIYVLWYDIAPLPGRIAMSAATIGLLSISAVVGAWRPELGAVTLCAGLLLHAVGVGFAMLKLRRCGEGFVSAITPALHLQFVAVIMAGISALPLGWRALTEAVFWPALGFAILIWAANLWRQAHVPLPAPSQRPLLALHLAPAGLLATAAGLLGYNALGQGLVIWASVIFIILLLTGRWITASGFTPLWGAFTFPITALATALIVNGWGPCGAALALITCISNPIIAFAIWRRWITGRLTEPPHT